MGEGSGVSTHSKSAAGKKKKKGIKTEMKERIAAGYP